MQHLSYFQASDCVIGTFLGPCGIITFLGSITALMCLAAYIYNFSISTRDCPPLIMTSVVFYSPPTGFPLQATTSSTPRFTYLFRLKQTTTFLSPPTFTMHFTSTFLTAASLGLVGVAFASDANVKFFAHTTCSHSGGPDRGYTAGMGCQALHSDSHGMEITWRNGNCKSPLLFAFSSFIGRSLAVSICSPWHSVGQYSDIRTAIAMREGPRWRNPENSTTSATIGYRLMSSAAGLLAPPSWPTVPTESRAAAEKRSKVTVARRSEDLLKILTDLAIAIASRQCPRKVGQR